MVGLREFRNTYKGGSFSYKLEWLFWELKYAWQRAWRGYDDVDVFELNSHFKERMLLILKDFRENNIGLFSDGHKELTEEQTNQVIDDIIFQLENSDEDGWIKILDSYDSKYYKEIETYETLAYLHEKEFLRLFVKWFDNLWY